MSRLTDEDGIDGPFERAMRRAEREDAKRVVIAADTIASVIAAVLTERKLYIVKPEHPGFGAIAMEAYGFGKACDAVALQGDDLAAFLAEIGARCAELLNARKAAA